MPGPSTGPAPAAPAPPTEAEKTLDEALAKIKALKSVSAKVRQDGKMLGQQFRIDGQYLKGPANQVYMLLELSGLGDIEGTMLQVSDGQVLWEFKKILDQSDIRKRTLGPILEKLNDPDCDPELREQVLAQLGFVGPEALIGGLRKAIEFYGKEAGTLDGKAIWIIRGRWKDRASLAGPNQPALPPTGPLPPYVPSLAEVWVGQEDGWPYFVKLYGQSPGIMRGQKQREIELGPDGRPVGPAVQVDQPTPSEIRMTFSEVAFNPELRPEQFAYQPPDGANVVDETQPIVNGLTAALANKAAQRKAEEAKAGPELPSTLRVPSPPSESETPPPVEALPVPNPAPAPK
jgi:outer membrane lipoprotein-sorting protein